MSALRALFGACLVAALLLSVQPSAAEVYPLILKGTVTMPDGSPPPFSVAVETLCSDLQGSAPGPLTNKKGEYIWRMDVDPLRTRACSLRATHPGYVSSSIDISALDGSTGTTKTMDPLVIRPASADPYTIVTSSSSVPSKANTSWKAAMKALDNRDYKEAVAQLQAGVAAAPKFAIGWHALGVVLDRMQNQTAQAHDAYQHAIDADPKMFPAYLALTRLSIRTKDWQGAANTADALIKIDSKKTVGEIYLHQAVARYGLKDLSGAETSAQEAVKLKVPRAEYVLGRVLEAKGDAAGAREHISKYLELEKSPDAALIRSHLENVGKAAPAATEPELLELSF